MQTISHAQLIGLPANVLIAFAFVVTAWVITRKTAVGRKFVAVGVNPRAAEAAGVRVLRYRIGAYVASAVCFAAAGMLLAGFIGRGTAAVAGVSALWHQRNAMSRREADDHAYKAG